MKKLLLLIAMGLLSVTQTINAQVPNYVPTNGLVSWYGFNNNANDTSVNTKNCIVTNATLTTDRFENQNSAYSFNGTSNFIGAPLINFNSNSISISTWVKPLDLINNWGRHILRQDNGIGGLDLLLSFQNNGTILSFGLGIQGQQYSELDVPIQAKNYIDSWHHIVITYDGSAKKIYSDGILIGTENRNGNVSFTPTATFSFGSACAFDYCAEKLKGNLDDIGIFNRALTQNEVLGLFNGTPIQATKTICEIGQDSSLLYQNGYVCGPENKIADQSIHVDTKWIDVKGIESIDVYTLQHRYFDYSRIYDQNNNLIWQWNGESVPSITWYDKIHTNINIAGNDKIRLEFSQGYNGFCNGYIKVIKAVCTAQTLGINDVEANNSIVAYPNPTTDFLNLNIDGEVNIKIYDLQGKLVMNQNITKQISLSELNKGLYLVEVSNNDIQYKTKIIKN